MSTTYIRVNCSSWATAWGKGDGEEEEEEEEEEEDSFGFVGIAENWLWYATFWHLCVHSVQDSTLY